MVFKTSSIHQKVDEIFKDKELLDQMVCFNDSEALLVGEIFKYIKGKLNKNVAKVSKEILIQKNA